MMGDMAAENVMVRNAVNSVEAGGGAGIRSKIESGNWEMGSDRAARLRRSICFWCVGSM
jgi:hypothetical protein